jgi:MurNAc alpha-1-phosphate uridylyltransferase
MTDPAPDQVPRHAMVLAAGLGLRMRPVTENLPKPLVRLAGRTLLDRALDHLAAAGVGAAVVNSHYLPHMIADHLASRAAPAITVSPEAELLDTGGGVAAALHRLGEQAFYVINADIAWLDGPRPALRRLAEDWRDADMDALLLLQDTGRAGGFDGAGDFFLATGGTLRRRGDAATAPLVFTGIQLLHPRLFAGAPGGAYSLNLLYDRALAERRLFGLVHDGDWFHVGTPTALALAEARLTQNADH